MAQQSIDAKELLVKLHKDVRDLSNRVEELEVKFEAVSEAAYVLLSFYLDTLYSVPAEQQNNQVIEHSIALLLAIDPERTAMMLITVAEAADQATFDSVCDQLEDAGIDVDEILRQRDAARRDAGTGEFESADSLDIE